MDVKMQHTPLIITSRKRGSGNKALFRHYEGRTGGGDKKTPFASETVGDKKGRERHEQDQSSSRLSRERKKNQAKKVTDRLVGKW